jgi:hypothetical protein
VRKAIAALSLVFLAAHIPFLPPTLEDIDSINFALGVADFDVAKHQPHPPGYPVFIALGKASTSILRAAGVPSPEPRGLAIWSAISGAALVWLLYRFFFAISIAGRGIQTLGVGLQPSPVAWWATVVAVTSPLFWFTALRPLSDMTGLAAAVAAQALIASAIAGTGRLRALTWGGFVAGLAIGIRSQTCLLTLPLLGLALVLPRAGLRARDRISAIAAAAIGVLAWGIPLIVASGGLSNYAAALGSQAGEDFSGVVMLWTTRKPRVALDALTFSFLWPWGQPIAAGLVIGIALVGAVRMLWKIPRALGLLLVAEVPYAIFHLLFHETITVRYALPLVAPIAYLVVCAFDWAGGALLAVGATALVAWSLGISVPATIWYGRHSSPAFMALQEAAAQSAVRDPAAGSRAIGLHAVARRAVDWLEAAPTPGPGINLGRHETPAVELGFRRSPDRGPRLLEAPHGREWLTLIDQWRADPASLVWFVADPRRTDLALFDPWARRGPLVYRWGFVEPPFVGGTRPGDSDLYAMEPPGWMLDKGWALTAEVAGVTAKDGLGPHRKPSVAWIRARPDAATLLIGGRHLGASNDPPVWIAISLNGALLDAFEVKPEFFFRLIALPAGTLARGTGYLPLDVVSKAADGSNRVIPLSLEQFDLQSPGTPMIGAEDGWYEPEYDPRTARSWRWTAEHATLWVRPVGRDVALTLAGESPLRYYDTAPALTVTLAGREVARFSPPADFTQEVVLPADALAAADGRVVITSDKFFVPAARDGSPDKRHLALRIYSYAVR